jgi:hypothetical protein
VAGRKTLFSGSWLRLVARFEHLDRMSGHNRRYGVFVHKLRVAVAPEQDAKIVEPGHDTLQFYTIDKENSERNLVFADKIQKCVLQVLGAFRCHLLKPCSFL